MLVVAVSTCQKAKKISGLLYRRQAAIISFGIHFPPPDVLLGIREERGGEPLQILSPPTLLFIRNFHAGERGGKAVGVKGRRMSKGRLSEGSGLDH